MCLHFRQVSGIMSHMSKHDHPVIQKPEPCKHELKFCEKCDAVECSKCGEEWVKPCKLPHNRFYEDKINVPYINPLQPRWNENPLTVLCSHKGETQL